MWGQLGTGNQTPSNKFVLVKGLPADVVALQAGGSTSGAICDSGRTYVWGRNDWGMLGLGNTTSKWAPVLVKGMVAVHPGALLGDDCRTFTAHQHTAEKLWLHGGHA